VLVLTPPGLFGGFLCVAPLRKGLHPRRHRKTTGRFLQIPFRFDPNRYQNDEKRNLKELGVLKDTIKGTSSPKNVQTIPFEGIHLKEFGVFFFVCFGCYIKSTTNS
jgi:hypothetical protein